MTRALRVRMLVAVAILAAAVACVIEATGSLDRLELSTVDTRFELRGEQPVPRRPRSSSASTTRRSTSTASAGRSRATASRRCSSRLRRRARGDRLRRPVHRAVGRPARRQPADRGVARRRQRGLQHDGDRRPAASRTSSAAARRSPTRGRTAGNGLFPEDPGGVFRRVPAEINGLDTLAVAAVKRLGRPVPYDRMGGDGAWIDFLGPPRPRARACRSPTSRRARSRPSAFRDKIVVVGATAPVLQDTHPVSWPERHDGRARRSTRPRSTTLLARRAAAVHRRGRQPRDRAGCSRSLAPLLALLRAPAGPGWRSPLAVGVALRCSPPSCCSTRAGSSRSSRRSPALAIGLVGTLLVLWLTRDVRARAHARRVRPLRARHGRRPGADAGDGGGRPAARRRADGRDGAVQRPARLHVVRRGARPRAGDRRAQPLPDGDERRDPRPRRHARRLHGRRDHGRVRRAGRVDRPRRPGARRRAGDARAARGVQRLDPRARARRRLQDGHRPALRAGDVGQRRLGAAARVRGDRRHDEHRRAARGDDEGHAVPALRRRADARPAAPRRRRTSSSCPSSRCAGASTASASGACASRPAPAALHSPPA